MTTRTVGLFASVTLATMAGLPTEQALAANDNGGPSPPQEAIDACANQREGSTCTMSFHGRPDEGTCAKAPGSDETLACALPHPPRQ